MDDELTAEMICVAVTALLAFIVTVPFLVAYLVSTSEDWFCDSRARPARLKCATSHQGLRRDAPAWEACDDACPREHARHDISVVKREDSHPRTADSRPARQQFCDESPRPAPCAPTRLAREHTRRDISMAKKASYDDAQAGDEKESFQEEESTELSCRHMAISSSKSTLDREEDHFPVTPPSTTPERGQDPSHNMSTHQRRGAQSSSDVMEPSSTAMSSSRRSGSTSGRIKQEVWLSSELPGAVAARRILCRKDRIRRAFSYTRRSDLYLIPEEDPV